MNMHEAPQHTQSLSPDKIASNHPHSYERFAQQEFYREVDRALISKAPIVDNVVDFATGTGAIIENLLGLGKLTSPFHVIGVDIDINALEIAREKFKKFGDNIRFVHAVVDQRISQIGDSSCKLVTFCNSIHLTRPREAICEASRILTERGTLLVNTAYEKLNAMPDNTARIWGTLVLSAQRLLQAQGYRDIPKPISLLKYSEQEFKEMAYFAGFSRVQTEPYTANMDRNAVKAICDYEDFAKGALPGIPVEDAITALIKSVDPLFDRFKIDFIPRNWMFLIAQKPVG